MRQTASAIQRWLRLTRTGWIAILAFVATWTVARLIAGTETRIGGKKA